MRSPLSESRPRPPAASRGSIPAWRLASRASGRSREGEQAMAGQRSHQSLRGTSCVGLLLGAAVLFVGVPAVWGEGPSSGLQVQQVQPRSIDRSLEGMRQGVLTRALNGTAWIDGSTYTLTSHTLVENRNGIPLQVKDLRCDTTQ